MRNKISKIDSVLKILRDKGQISNADCLNGTHGFRTNRLSGVINVLKNKGLIVKDNEKSGWRDGIVDGDWIYVIKPLVPKSSETFIVRGVNDDGSDRIIKRVIW